MKTIELTQGKVTIVDDEDYEELNKHWWYANKSDTSDVWYVIRRSGSVFLRMHRVILNAPDDKWVDHIDGDGLNNRRSNLRLVNPTESALNRTAWGASGVRGVFAHGPGWEAGITVGGKRIHLGTYPTKEEASAVYEAYRSKIGR